MAVNKRQVETNFRRSAATYDEYAVFQRQTAFELMQQIKNSGRKFKQILEIGCGTGFLTEMLAEEYPQALILATDLAPEMIEVAKAKLGRFKNVVYSIADGENPGMVENNSFDLVASNMVFQWFNDYVLPFSQYYQALTNGGCLIFSTLGVGTFDEMYSCLNQIKALDSGREALDKRKPFISKEELGRIMKQVGFAEVEITEATRQEFFASCRDFLRSLKKTGAYSYLTGDLEKTQGIGPEIFKLIKEYDLRFRSHQGVVVSYRCLFGSGMK